MTLTAGMIGPGGVPQQGAPTMSILGWMGRRPPGSNDSKPTAPVANKRPKIDKAEARERAMKNSPWRYDDGPSRRPAGNK
jgi:hypothetical protein